MKNIRSTSCPVDEKRTNGRINDQSAVGFTAIELLVVIANLALVAVILMPVLHRTVTGAKEIQCRNNLRQLGAAELMYLDENNGNMFPYQSSLWMPPLALMNNSLSNVMVCPVTRIWTPTPDEETVGDYKTAWFWQEPPPSLADYNGSYTINGWLYGGPIFPYGSPGDFFIRKSAVIYPAQTPVFSDGIWPDAFPLETDPPVDNLQNGGSVGSGSPNVTGMGRLMIDRHGPTQINPPPIAVNNKNLWPGGVNFVFFDGHMDDVSLNNLWSQYWHVNWSNPPRP